MFIFQQNIFQQNEKHAFWGIHFFYNIKRKIEIKKCG